MPAYYYDDSRFSSLSFMKLSDSELSAFIHTNHFSPNEYWTKDNPVLHCFLANEHYSYVERFLDLFPDRINPNLCDGSTYGKKSLLITLALLPCNSLTLKFIELYKDKLNLDYQDKLGRTALHYAVILGRTDIVKRLIELGASLEIQDKQGLTPIDYLDCSQTLIVKTLNSIDINPSRDVKANRNDISYRPNCPLVLQGTGLTQSKPIMTRLINTELTLVKYINGSSDWSTFFGDDAPETHETLLNLAKDIANHHNIPLSSIFVCETLPANETENFKENLRILTSDLSGQSILDQCLDGHTQMKQLNLSSAKIRNHTM